MRAKIAGRGLLPDGCLLAARALWIVHHHFERMKIDVSIRAILRAQPATDAPILDDDFQRISPADGTYRASHHTQRIAALPATRGYQILIEAQSVAYQPRHAVVC